MPSAMPKADGRANLPMRFDLVDLQLFVAVAETPQHHARRAPRPSGAGLRQRADQGPGSGARRLAAQARPPRRRAHRGRRKPARSCPDRPPQCRGDARRSRRLFQRREGDRAVCSPIPRACRNICRRRWPPSCAEHPHISIDVEERESGEIAAAIATGAADLGLGGRARAARQHRADSRSARTGWCWSPRARTNWPAAGRSISAKWSSRDFVGLITSSALHAHVTGHAARLGARLRFRARLNNFDAIGQMVAAGIGVAVMPEIAARRCARSMKINVIRIRDPWANRRLVDLRPQFQGAAAAGASNWSIICVKPRGE